MNFPYKPTYISNIVFEAVIQTLHITVREFCRQTIDNDAPILSQYKSQSERKSERFLVCVIHKMFKPKSQLVKLTLHVLSSLSLLGIKKINNDLKI